MLYGGYLNAISYSHSYDGYFCSLTAPNKEVRGAYRLLITQWINSLDQSYNIHRAFVKCFISNEENSILKLKTIIEDYLKSCASSFDFSLNSEEKTYQVFMFGLLYSLSDAYEVISNKESGTGRFDIMLVSKHDHYKSYVLEFKVIKGNEDVDKAVNDALNQIKEKEYISTLRYKQKKLISIIGLVFKGREVFLKAEVV